MPGDLTERPSVHAVIEVSMTPIPLAARENLGTELVISWVGGGLN